MIRCFRLGRVREPICPRARLPTIRLEYRGGEALFDRLHVRRPAADRSGPGRAACLTLRLGGAPNGLAPEFAPAAQLRAAEGRPGRALAHGQPATVDLPGLAPAIGAIAGIGDRRAVLPERWPALPGSSQTRPGADRLAASTGLRSPEGSRRGRAERLGVALARSPGRASGRPAGPPASVAHRPGSHWFLGSYHERRSTPRSESRRTPPRAGRRSSAGLLGIGTARRKLGVGPLRQCQPVAGGAQTLSECAITANDLSPAQIRRRSRGPEVDGDDRRGWALLHSRTFPG